ncbi:MAG TPA: dihydrolipoamide acetyltransferase family protein, partial [Mycobacterium sp.]|nr:dihydrolipoamide acetyltransferase family protein [Mycobacterium sp.]
MSDFLVPDLGEGLLDATITRWAVSVGDVVELNQTLCTVETNKAEVEIPSPYVGRIVALGGAEGETLAVGTLLVRIDTGAEEKRTPVLVGYGTDNGMDRSRRPRAAPKVRKLAADLDVDLSSVAASGIDGIVTREDVLAAGSEAETIVVQGVRARMAAQMSLSRSRIPDAHARVQADCSALLRLRDRLEVTPFVLTLRMLLIALGRHPLLNATWLETEGDQRITLHRGVQLGVAVATERGLVVPVIKDAHTLTLRRLAAVVDDIVERGRGGRLAPAELGGSTFTVS